MEALLELLERLHPEIDYETYDTLFEDNIFEDDEWEVLLNGISHAYDVQIPESEINEENFNSAETIYDLIERLQEEG